MTFEETFRSTFAFNTPCIDLGHVLRNGQAAGELTVRIPLSTMNRHGLIAGSTGTGKTRTLQLLAEGLSRQGVPVFLADVKGDLAGLSRPGEANERINARVQSVGGTFVPESFPVEFFSLTGARGAQLRATVSSFGPVLLGKVLDLTEVQQSVLAMVFQYCDDRQMALLDFDDLRSVLNHLSDEGKGELKEYGGMSSATVGVLVRKMVELEQQGADKFFGEPQLDLADLLRTVQTPAGARGVINVLSLSDVQDKPRLYSTFLMWLLGEFYEQMPEVGDPDKPKLVFFFDEAHQLFDDASSALTEHIEQVSRLIRSKGIGVFFITQMPTDVPDNVLAQLGNRVQHAIRAFTPKDAKNVKATASTFPPSEFVDVAKSLTSLGTGEALVTVLSPRGIPTQVATAQILPPSSSMGTVDDAAYASARAASSISAKYATAINRESAHEIVQKRLAASAEAAQQEQVDDAAFRPAPRMAPSAASRPRAARAPARSAARARKSGLERIAGNAVNQATRTITQQVVRGIFGLLRGK